MTSFPSENRVYVGAYGYCLDRKGRLLLTRLAKGSGAGSWTLPGGGVLWGEDPDQALLREMEEETGLVDLEILSITAVYSHTYHQSPENPLPPLHHIGIIYHLETPVFKLRNEIEGSTDQCRWLTEKEARSLTLASLGKFAANLAWPSADV